MKKLFKKLFLKNVRAGFATNSSSSHSLVFYTDEKIASIDNSFSPYQFGWDSFIVKDKFSKLVYGLLSVNGDSWLSYYEDNPSEAIEEAKDRYESKLDELSDGRGEAIIQAAYGSDKYNYVDHQSRPGTSINGFEFLDILAQDNVVVHGGNDNGGPGPESFILADGVIKVIDPRIMQEEKFFLSYRKARIARPMTEELEKELLSTHKKDNIEDIITIGIFDEDKELKLVEVSRNTWKDWPIVDGETYTDIEEFYADMVSEY